MRNFHDDPMLSTEILEEMKSRSTGRWDWEKSHLCFTGKNADLEPWGQQALELIDVTEEKVFFRLHCGATISGGDVCLNLPKEIEADDSDEGADKYDEIRQIYLDQAQEVVCGTGNDFGGYWSGDDWWLDWEVKLDVPMTLNGDGEPDVAAIVDAMEKTAQPDIEYWEHELGLAHKILDVLSGWKDNDGNRVPEGQVAEGSAYWMWENYAKDGPAEAEEKAK